MKKLSLFGLLLALFVFVIPAFGQTTVWYFTGTVTSLFTQGGAVLPAGVNVGDSVTGTFSYGVPSSSLTYPFVPTTQTTNYSFSSGVSFSATIGANTWSYVSTGGTISIENGSNMNRDYVSFTPTGTPTSFPGSIPGFPTFPSSTLTFIDSSNTYDMVSGTSLPTATGDINLAAATSATGRIGSSTSPGFSWSINYSVNSLSTSAIPEPQTYVLLAGLATLMLTVYRRKSRKFYKKESPG
jgi:hypothetical protein